MLTKKQLADIVIIQASGGAPSETKIQRNDVYAVVDSMISEMVGIEAEKAFKMGVPIDSNWVSTFEHQVIQFNNYDQRCFVALPASRISLNGDRDIVSVTWAQGDDTPFDVINQNSEWAWKNLDAVGVMGSYLVKPDDSRLIFTNMPKRFAGQFVTLRYICGVDGYGEDDKLLLPDNFEARLINMVSQWFGRQQVAPAKGTNDVSLNTN